MKRTVKAVRGELIGLAAKVLDSKNQSCIGMQGKIIDETKNMLVLSTEKGDKKLVKSQNKIEITIKGKKTAIDGNSLNKRPEDRIKSKVSK